uniref:Nicotiana tabacum ORF n=1 Tax=Nicotiana tabacum TaxID=4097 RepID=P93386_TOBAC|nr:ORF; able to induce HR-like lesions [Nicotiana tabacum]
MGNLLCCVQVDQSTVAITEAIWQVSKCASAWVSLSPLVPGIQASWSSLPQGAAIGCALRDQDKG